MRRITDTELVRNYCEKHNGDIFDINYASEHIFKDIPHVNLRKIVSRLIYSGLLRTISKGVYVIGESDLSDEEMALYGDSIQKCVLEHRGYPILIASHIKPYRVCEPSEQFDRDNGLLLSKNMDSLFDGGYITFDNDGNVVPSTKLDKEVADYVKGFKLDDKIFNFRRQLYMQYHRDHVFLG